VAEDRRWKGASRPVTPSGGTGRLLVASPRFACGLVLLIALIVAGIGLARAAVTTSQPVLVLASGSTSIAEATTDLPHIYDGVRHLSSGRRRRLP
jgi:hypothetical protein